MPASTAPECRATSSALIRRLPRQPAVAAYRADLAAKVRARLLQMANVAAEKRPMTDVARGYERACDEVLEFLREIEGEPQ